MDNARSQSSALQPSGTKVVVFAARVSPGGPPLTFFAPTDVIAAGLGRLGYSLLILTMPTQREMMAKLQEIADRRTCEAVLLWGDDDDTIEQATLLEKLETPFVIKGHHESHRNWRQIDFDHLGMARLGVELLASRGHHRIAYVGHNNEFVYAQTLLRGYREAMEKVHPLTLPSHFVLAIDEVDQLRSQVTERVEYWMEISERQRPTALFMSITGGAWTDLEVALRAHGIRMGYGRKDFHVAGIAPLFNRLYYGRAYCFRDVNLQTLGERVVCDLLMPLLTGDDSKPRIVSYLPDLVPIDNPYFADEG